LFRVKEVLSEVMDVARAAKDLGVARIDSELRNLSPARELWSSSFSRSAWGPSEAALPPKIAETVDAGFLKLRSTKGSRSSSVRLSSVDRETSEPNPFETINHYDPELGRRTIFQRFPVANPEGVKQDLSRMFGRDLDKILRGRKDVHTSLTTPGLNLQLQAEFRRDFRDIYMPVADTYNSGSALFVDFRKSGEPWRVRLNNDEEGLFNKLFRDLGHNNLAESIPVSDHRMVERLASLERYVGSKSDYQQFSMNGANHESLYPFLGLMPAGRMVEQGHFAVAPIDQPLGTTGLVTCLGLNVVDKTSGLQYLAHVDGTATPQRLVRSLQGFDLMNSDIRVMPGPLPSGSMIDVVSVFKQKGALENMKQVNGSTYNGMFPGFVGYKGKVHEEPVGMEKWEPLSNGRFANL
jgi:hypothetical protein